MAETDQERRSRAERRRADEAATRRAEADSAAKRAEAEAKARAAEADARAIEAKAKADAAIADAAARRAKDDAELADANAKRAAERDQRKESERRAAEAAPWQVGASAAAVPAGIAAGVALSKVIEKRHLATVAAANKELKGLAGDARTVISSANPKSGRLSKVATAKLSAIVATSDQMKLGRTRGPLGLATAGLLVAEAGIARFGIAEQIKDEKAKALVGAVATASVFAATNLVGERMIQNATPKLLPAARDVAAIETARNLVPGAMPAAKPSTAANAAAKYGPFAGKVVARALPVAAVAFAIYEGVKGYQKEGAAGAAAGVGDSLTFGLVSAGRAYLSSDAQGKAEKSISAASQPVASSTAPGGRGGSGRVWVAAHTRADGSKVDGHWRQRN